MPNKNPQKLPQKTKQQKASLEIYVGDEKRELAIHDIVTARQIDLLAAPTPPKYIKQRQGRGGIMLDYVEGHYVKQMLNAVFGFNCDDEIMKEIIDWDNKQIAMLVRLTVRFADGQVVHKDGWGGSDIKYNKKGELIDLADDLKSAATDGLKVAASKLGIAWDVYSGQTKNNIKKKPAPKEDAPEEIIDVEPEQVTEQDNADISDLATNPEEEIQEAQELGEEIKKVLADKTIDTKDFKLWLSEIQDEMDRKFVGLHYKHPSFRKGAPKDLRYLTNWLHDRSKDGVDQKGFIAKYLEARINNKEA